MAEKIETIEGGVRGQMGSKDRKILCSSAISVKSEDRAGTVPKAQVFESKRAMLKGSVNGSCISRHIRHFAFFQFPGHC